MKKSSLIFCSLALLSLAASLHAADKRPNILFCISDDQSFAHTGVAITRVVGAPGFEGVARERLFRNIGEVIVKTPARAFISTTLFATPPPAGHHEALS